MTSIGFQLYSLHAVDEPLPAVVERVGDTGFEGVELAGLGGAPVDDVAAALDGAGLDAASAHVDVDDVEGDPAGVADTYRRLGCDDVVIPWLPPENFDSVEATESAAERLAALGGTLSDHGVTLHYHNHDQEFRTLGEEPALTHLLAACDPVRLQLDVGWAGAAGLDPLTLLRRHSDRIRSVHLKDYDAERGEVCEVGSGDLDVAAVVEAVRELKVEWLIYEAEDAPDSYDTLEHAEQIRAEYWE